MVCHVLLGFFFCFNLAMDGIVDTHIIIYLVGQHRRGLDLNNRPCNGRLTMHKQKSLKGVNC